MRIVTAAAVGLVLVIAGSGLPPQPSGKAFPEPSAAPATPSLPAPAALTPAQLTKVVQQYCVVCHNDQLLTGNLSLEKFAVEAAPERAVAAEKVIGKLRAGMMPPPGMPRPGGDTLRQLVETLEGTMDRAASRRPDPGTRSFQRLNRAEYQASIQNLLGLDVDAGAYLPLDTKSDNFDNIADVQMMSSTLLDAYLNAAAEISRLTIGNRRASPHEVTYSVSGYASQLERVEGAPFGTRGGLSVVHTFPADGDYAFRIVFAHTTTGEGFAGSISRGEQVEISINGERVALIDVDQFLNIASPDGIAMRTDPVHVRAGPQRVSAAFLKKNEGPITDLMSPHEWSLADRHTGMAGYGLTLVPHLQDLVIGGPFAITGISDSEPRRKIFRCRPLTPAAERPCALRIVEALASEAYRRPASERDVVGLMKFYDQGAADGGFETGVQTALQAILASVHFIFRVEEQPAGARPGSTFRIADTDLASRLSFFLWGTPPDQELIDLAERGKLADRKVLEAQARRLLADPRSEALATRFAAQWLRLQDLDKVHPDSYWFPDFDQQLADAMRRETELFFYDLVRRDGSFLDLFTADYTFANERLAKHYGIAGVWGDELRRVKYPDDARRGLLGQGSVLVLTSHADRTSPVLRGKWVMEVLLGTPPPPPPPGVPALEETKGDQGGRQLTTRERMEMHRSATVCRSCHMFMDPIGLALDNFDVTGKWRIRENGAPLDTRGQLYDGTPLATPADLRAALLTRPEPLVRTFTENLMAFALGRRIEVYDKPVVRRIARQAEADGYRLSSFILAVVKSDAFQMKRVPNTVTETAAASR